MLARSSLLLVFEPHGGLRTMSASVEKWFSHQSWQQHAEAARLMPVVELRELRQQQFAQLGVHCLCGRPCKAGNANVMNV